MAKRSSQDWDILATILRAAVLN